MRTIMILSLCVALPGFAAAEPLTLQAPVEITIDRQGSVTIRELPSAAPPASQIQLSIEDVDMMARLAGVTPEEYCEYYTGGFYACSAAARDGLRQRQTQRRAQGSFTDYSRPLDYRR